MQQRKTMPQKLLYPSVAPLQNGTNMNISLVQERSDIRQTSGALEDTSFPDQ